MDKARIEELVNEGQLEQALKELDEVVKTEVQNDEAFLMRGKLLWKMGKRTLAMTDYEHAAHLNPSSPAVQLLEHANSIMDFFNPDQFNP